MNIYLDSEFSGLHQNTTLISIGLITEDGDSFYAELSDYDKNQIDSWLEDNVISNLTLQEKTHNKTYYNPKSNSTTCFCNKTYLKKTLTKWLNNFDKVEIWSDCLAYDWVLFNEIFGGAFEIPKNVYYIPFDLSTAFKLKGIDPDISREEFSGITSKDAKHNSLFDAKVIKKCYEKLNL